MEIGERSLVLHGQTETLVVSVGWVRPTIPVVQKTVRAERVIVGTFRGRGDRQGNVGEDMRLEDSLGAEEGNSYAIEHKSIRKDLPRQDVPEDIHLTDQPLEGRRPDFRVVRAIEQRRLSSAAAPDMTVPR